MRALRRLTIAGLVLMLAGCQTPFGAGGERHVAVTVANPQVVRWYRAGRAVAGEGEALKGVMRDQGNLQLVRRQAETRSGE